MNSDIPLSKLEPNSPMALFIEWISARKLPNPSTIRRVYVDKVYNEKLFYLRERFKSKLILVSVDETTDSMGRYIVNVCAAILDGDDYFPPNHILTKIVDKGDTETILQTVVNALALLWPTGLNIIMF
jgi:hypothetical protein